MTPLKRLIQASVDANAYHQGCDPNTIADCLNCTCRSDAERGLLTLLAHLPALGLALVPVVATEGMAAWVQQVDVESQTDLDWPDGYAIMLAAAPDLLREDAP